MISGARDVARGTIFAAMMALTASVAQAQETRNDGAFLYESCSTLASAPEDLSNVNGLELIKAMTCSGYLNATHAALIRIHEHYKAIFPKYGQWRDETFIKGWIATQILLAPDVCFPKIIRPKTLAMIISKYGKAHPEELPRDMFIFAASAFQNAYPPNQCAP